MKRLHAPTPVFLALLMLGSACRYAPASESDAEAFFGSAESIPFTSLSASSITLAQGQYGSYKFDQRQNLVFTEAGDFAAFWTALHSNRNPVPRPPAVDFGSDMVVAVLLGIRPSGGYGAEVVEIGERAGRLGVRVREWTPAECHPVPTVITSPYHIVKTARSSVPISFFDEKQGRNCER